MHIELSNNHKLAVGLTWRTIISANKSNADVLKKAKDISSKAFWFDAESRMLGLTPKAFKLGKTPVYPAIVLFARWALKLGDKNALLIYKTAQDDLIFLGVIDGKPHRDFDYLVQKESEISVTNVMEQFRAQLSGHMQIYSNIQSYSESNDLFDWNALTVDAPSELDAMQSVRAASKVGTALLVWFVLLTAVAGVSGGAWMLWNDYKIKQQAATQIPPQVRYETSVNALAPNTPINIGSALPAISLLTREIPSSVGGWAFSGIEECRLPDSITGDMMCRLLYTRLPGLEATNASFVANVPKDWQVSVIEASNVIRATRNLTIKPDALASILQRLPSQRQTLLDVGSKFQQWGLLVDAKLDTPTVWGIPTEIVDPKIAPVTADNIIDPIRRGSWSWSGPARSLELISVLPPNFTVSVVRLGVKNATESNTINIKDSEFMIEKIEGFYYVR